MVPSGIVVTEPGLARYLKNKLRGVSDDHQIIGIYCSQNITDKLYIYQKDDTVGVALCI